MLNKHEIMYLQSVLEEVLDSEVKLNSNDYKELEDDVNIGLSILQHELEEQRENEQE